MIEQKAFKILYKGLFQLVKLLEFWYIAKFLLHSLFHHVLEMLTNFENLFQKSSTIEVNF